MSPEPQQLVVEPGPQTSETDQGPQGPQMPSQEGGEKGPDNAASGPGPEDQQRIHETNIFNTHIQQITGGGQYQSHRTLSRNDFTRYDDVAGFMREVHERVYSTPEDNRLLHDILRSHNIALVTGRAELGKIKIGHSVAAHLCQEQELDGVWQLAGRLGRDLTFDLRALADDSSFHNKVLLLKDAFDDGNESLRAFACDIDDSEFRAHCKRLARCRIYLILTSDSERVPRDLVRVIRQIRANVQGPSEPMREVFLGLEAQRYIDQQRSSHRDQLRTRLQPWIAEHKSLLLEQLDTLPRLERFLRNYLLPLLQEQLTLAQAFDGFHRPDHWLLEEKADDLEILSHVIGLTLCTTSAVHDQVSWYLFDQMRRLVTRALRTDLHRQREPHPVSRLCAGPAILATIEAEVTAEDGRGSQIRFRDNRRSEAFWACLLGSGRGLLSALVPRLQQQASKSGSPLREVSMRALGRIGQLDPALIAAPVLLGTHGDGGIEDGLALGAFIQGGLGSSDERYRDECKRKLRRLLTSDLFVEADVGILALARVGLTELPLAIRALRHVLELRLVPWVEYLVANRQVLRDQEHEVVQRVTEIKRDAPTLGAALDHIVETEWLRFFAAILPAGGEWVRPEGDRRILLRANVVLIGLLSVHGALPIVNELARWLAPGNRALAGLLGFAFLRHGYVLDSIEAMPQELPGSHGRIERWSPLVHSAAHHPDGVESLQRFLVELYQAVEYLPAIMGAMMRERWMSMLKNWLRQAARGRRHRDVVISLTRSLLKAPDPELQDSIWELLRSDCDFTERGSKLEKLAMRIMAGEA